MTFRVEKQRGTFNPFHFIRGAEKTGSVHVSDKKLEKRQSSITELTHVIQCTVFISLAKM